MFKLDAAANPTGTCLAAEINVTPAKLVKAFGDPEEGDAYKSSGEYYFTDDRGNVFTVYDWKCTSLYSSGYESPADFWAATEPREIHIGAAGGDWRAFREWLLRKLGERG